jgi:hypothetical protein
MIRAVLPSTVPPAEPAAAIISRQNNCTLSSVISCWRLSSTFCTPRRDVIWAVTAHRVDCSSVG